MLCWRLLPYKVEKALTGLFLDKSKFLLFSAKGICLVFSAELGAIFAPPIVVKLGRTLYPLDVP